MGRSRCSIVIPVHNKAALTRQCLDSIFTQAPELEFEVIVVDDASTDSTPEMLREFRNVRVVRIDSNAGFATACNTGAEAARSDYVVFLNNDTIACEGWLDTLVAYADEHPEAAAVGARLLYPDGKIQHAGVAFNMSGDPLHIYAGFPADHPAVKKSRRFQAVTAACLLIDRKEFYDIDGFDTDYHNDLEDVDLCLRLGERNEEVHYCHESVLYHLESLSRGHVYKPGTSALLYRKRWRGKVKGDELDYYLEDGLLDILRVSPELLKTDGGRRRRDAEVLQERSRQLLDLFRESVRASTLAEAHRNGSSEPKQTRQFVGEERAGLRIVGRTRRRLEKQVLGLRQELEGAMGGYAPPVTPSGQMPTVAAGPSGYPRVVADVQRTVNEVVPEGATVLVVSRGDEALVRLDGRHGWHFPRATDGRFRGYYPASGEDAIKHLEELREQGAGYIVFPSTYRWWFDYYVDFARHLDGFKKIADGESCVIFEMDPADAGIEPAGGQTQPDSSQDVTAAKGKRIRAEEYLALIERTKQVASVALPPGVTALVVSRGDDALVDLEDRIGWHFPRGEDGRYLGYYPATDEDAIEHLEELRAAGAEYLLFPSSAFWWLTHYDAFADHLRGRYQTVYEDVTCVVFGLAERLVANVVESLLPERAKIALVSRYAGDLAWLDRELAFRLEPASQGEEAIAGLERLVASGAEFLVIPESAFSWLAERPEFGEYLGATHRFVTRQQHACEIWELRAPASESPAPSPDGASAHGPHREAAGKRRLPVLRDLLRRRRKVGGDG
jgi:GT2 family glycosyltransferase